MSNKLVLREVEQDEFPKWDEFVDESPQGSIFSKSFWLKYNAELIDGQFKILAVFNGDLLLGGIGICIKQHMLGKEIKVPVLTPYSSVILRNPSTKYPHKIASEQLNVVEKIIHQIKLGKYLAVKIINTPRMNDVRAFYWDNWTVKPGYTYEIPLSNFDDTKGMFAHSVRKQVNKSEKSNIQVKVKDDFESLYSFLKSTFKKRERPLFLNKNKFQKLYNNLKKHNCCKMYFAELDDGKPISGRIALFTKHQVAHDWVAGSDPDYLNSGATPFLIFKILEDLSQNGYKYFDMDGANVPTIARFKSTFGGDLRHYFISEYNRYIALEVYKLLKNRAKSWIKKKLWNDL
jgi:hypothetical protein